MSKMMNSSAILLFILVGCVVIIHQPCLAVKVRVIVEQGALVGVEKEAFHHGLLYYAFQGIPYAEPPVGHLRFMPPKPLQKWNGTFEAVKDQIKCPQEDPLFDRYPNGSEDCLVLNVYTPKLPKRPSKNGYYAVMFWIHGGGFSAGSSSTDLYGPDFFTSDGVVLVTINYRLGALGFMNLEDGIVTGNMGLKDIVLGLKWVKSNIHVFNGDANRVTIFGNNAGATAVTLLMRSPMAKGLFTNAICQSGTYKLPQLFIPNPKERAYRLAHLLNKPAENSKELLSNLSNMNPLSIVKMTERTFDSTEVRDKQRKVVPFGPSLEVVQNKEDAFLTAEDLKRPFDDNIPFMIGFNSKEAIVFLRTIINDPDILEKLNYNFQFTLPLRDLQFEYNSKDYRLIADKIKNFYFPRGVLGNDSMSDYIDYISDGIFYPVHKTLREQIKASKAKTFYYSFSYDGDLNYFKKKVMINPKSIQGATQGDEICYLFKCNHMNDLYESMSKLPVEPEELMISDMFVRLWTNFAKFGHPIPRYDSILHNLAWTPVSSNNHYYMDIGEMFELKSNPRLKNIKFWDWVYTTYAGMEPDDYTAREELSSMDTVTWEAGCKIIPFIPSPSFWEDLRLKIS